MSRSCLALGLFSLACTTSVSQRGATVRAFSNDSWRGRGCAYLGQVEGRSLLGGPALAGQGAVNARNEMREKAAAMGGTDLNILSEDQSGGTHSIGEVYLCPPAGAPRPEVACVTAFEMACAMDLRSAAERS